jgi:hypothetical protein
MEPYTYSRESVSARSSVVRQLLVLTSSSLGRHGIPRIVFSGNLFSFWIEEGLSAPGWSPRATRDFLGRDPWNVLLLRIAHKSFFKSRTYDAGKTEKALALLFIISIRSTRYFRKGRKQRNCSRLAQPSWHRWGSRLKASLYLLRPDEYLHDLKTLSVAFHYKTSCGPWRSIFVTDHHNFVIKWHLWRNFKTSCIERHRLSVVTN